MFLNAYMLIINELYAIKHRKQSSHCSPLIHKCELADLFTKLQAFVPEESLNNE